MLLTGCYSWKSFLFDKIKRDFFQAVAEFTLFYECTLWTLSKLLEEKLNGNNTKILRAVLNKFWKQHFTKQKLSDHLSFIWQIIHVRQTRQAGHLKGSKDELKSDSLLWTPRDERISIGRPIYSHQISTDTTAMDNRGGWRERIRIFCVLSMIWWWWWWWWWK